MRADGGKAAPAVTADGSAADTAAPMARADGGEGAPAATADGGAADAAGETAGRDTGDGGSDDHSARRGRTTRGDRGPHRENRGVTPG